MEIDDKYHFKNKLDYVKLLVKISRIRYRGEDPPEEFLNQARELGQLIGVSKEELNNPWASKYVKFSPYSNVSRYRFVCRPGYLVSV